MAEISSIILPNGSARDLKDASARASCALLSSSKADVSCASKVVIKDPSAEGYENGLKTDLSVIKLTNSDYQQLVVDNQTQPNAEYIISDDYFNAYGQQIKNVAPGIDLSDAATIEQINAVSSQLSDYALTSHTHSQYSLTSHNHNGVYAAVSHSHGNIQNGGALQTTDITIENGDKLVVTDASDSNKVARTSIAFDGSTTNQFLSKKGTWLTALTAHQAISATYVNQHIRLSANGSLVGNIDCSDFIKDGMLSTVELCSDQLIFKFNTDAGQDAISVALSNFIDETNYYTKAELTGSSGILTSYVPTTRTVAGQALTANVTAATISSAIGLGNYALNSNVLHKSGDETATGKKTFSDAFTVGTRKSGSTVGTKSFAYGANNTASGEGSLAGGQNCVASEAYAVAEGYQTSALGYVTHAEGQQTYASDYCAHAEGYMTSALNYGHSEGCFTYTNGAAHAEGIKSVANCMGSHAEGNETSALQYYSHAEGTYTLANNDYEHAQGILNISNKGSSPSSNTIDSIGIGTNSNARKNATEVMQNGDAYFLGVGGYDGTNAASATSMPLADVINAKADISSVSKVFIKDPGEQEYADGKQSDLSVIKLTNAEYAQLVTQSQTQPNAEYIISDDYFNGYGQQIKNVALGTDLSDVAIVEQVNAVSSQLSDYALTAWVRSTIQSTAFYTLNTLGSGTSFTLTDHAINAKTLTGNTTFTLPSTNTNNVARDFAIYIAVPATQYSVTFAVPSGETMTFKGDGFTAWPILDASSYYIFTFTELNSSGTFLVGYKKLSDIS